MAVSRFGLDVATRANYSWNKWASDAGILNGGKIYMYVGLFVAAPRPNRIEINYQTIYYFAPDLLIDKC